MGISSLIYDSWMKERQYKKYDGIYSMLQGHPPDLKGSVLDVGIGTGLFEDYMKGKGIEMRVQGVDVDSHMMEEAKRKGYNVQYGSADNLQFKDSTFDFVICIDSLHKVKEPYRAVDEIHRVLKPDKYALLAMFCNTLNKREVMTKLETLVEGSFDILEKRIVGRSDDELSAAILVREGGKKDAGD
jgi:ubiquinone/menaquinone biosynthesis C-methylase UbiE